MRLVNTITLSKGCYIAAAYHHLLHYTQHTTMSRIPNPATRTEHGVCPITAMQAHAAANRQGHICQMCTFHKTGNGAADTEVYLFIGRETHRETGDQKNSEIIFILG